MKRTVISFFCTFIVFGAMAQNMYDAMTYSQNNYYGTARSMAMGNAVTAVGGDLGTIGINPAGSAVAGYSQFAVTPGLAISSVSASYSPAGTSGFGSPFSSGNTRVTLPNLGFSMNFKTGSDYGIKNFTVAVVSNFTNSYNMAYSTGGFNSMSSAFAEKAYYADPYSPLDLDNYDSYQNTDIPWDIISAYRANLFSYVGDNQNYVGNTEALPQEGWSYVPGKLDQGIQREKRGYKSDIVVNFGMNLSDRLYLGANLGFPTMRYRYDEYYTESAVNPEDFPVTFINDYLLEESTYFKSGKLDYAFEAFVRGIYAKIGAIFLPVKGLRLGLAFQSPSNYTVSESWQYFASSSYDNYSFNGSASSPTGSYSYCLRTPYIVDAGIAYTFGQYGMLSVDYELMDYSIMRFKNLYSNSYGNNQFNTLNEVNSMFCGVSHNVRVGAEVKFGPMFALRAGYSLLTTPEKYATLTSGGTITADEYLANPSGYRNEIRSFSFFDDLTHAASLGFGYSSGGSFYADVAARVNFYPTYTDAPYYDYDYYGQSGEWLGEESPRVSVCRKLFDVALTMGWRF